MESGRVRRKSYAGLAGKVRAFLKKTLAPAILVAVNAPCICALIRLFVGVFGSIAGANILRRLLPNVAHVVFGER